LVLVVCPLGIFTVEIGVGEGETLGVVVAPLETEVLILLRFNLPVITAKKTRTTTSPKIKEITLLKLSICHILYHTLSYSQHWFDFLEKKRENQNMDKNPQVVYQWRAPLRPYKRRSALILRFYLAVAFLLSAIVFFFGDKILIIPIWALVFLFYVLTITPPPEVDNKVTTFGIEAAGVTARFEMLSHFYFGKRFGFYTLTVVSQPPYFYHFYLVVPSEEIKNNLVKILSNHLIYQEKPQKTITDKMLDFLSSLMPDDEIEARPASV